MRHVPDTGAAVRASYEFTEQENVRIGSTAKFARWWGMMSLALGVVLLGLAIVVAVVGLDVVQNSGPRESLVRTMLALVGPLGVVYFVCGTRYIETAKDLDAVVTTEGRDMPLLMSALRSLMRAFRLEAVCLLLAFTVGVGVALALRGPR